MKNVVFLFVMLLSWVDSKAQNVIGKDSLQLLIKVIEFKGEEIPLDSLFTSWDSTENVPEDLTIPRYSSLSFSFQDVKSKNVDYYMDGDLEKRFTASEPPNGSISSSSSGGSQREILLVDRNTGDSLQLKWRVQYAPIILRDLYPADYFAQYVTYELRTIFSDYPDSSLYNWKSEPFIKEINEKGIPIRPEFPASNNGLLFVIDEITEETIVRLRGLYDEYRQMDPKEPYQNLLYRDLPPGKYTFEALPYKGAVQEVGVRYEFTILKPWWQETSTILIAIVVVLITFGGLGFILYRRKQIRLRERINLQKKLSEAELKAIRAQLNPHFLFNTLSSIQNLIGENRNTEAENYLNRLSRLLRRVLKSSQNPFHTLSEELELIEWYLELEALRFNFKFSVKQSKEAISETMVPVLILQPFVENAVKHGVSYVNDGFIEIEIEKVENYLIFIIRDNGPGLSEPGEGSLGLELSRKKMSHLSEYYGEDVNFKIKNRPETKGVEVIIELPLS